MLDTVATIMPAVTDHHNSSFFRISVDLDREIDRDELQAAVDGLADRCTMFFVHLAKTWSGWKLSPLKRPPRVEDDSGVPCKGVNIHVRGAPLVRILVRQTTLALEVSHVVTDGYGAVVLLKAVLAEYLIKLYPHQSGARDAERRTSGILCPADPVPAEETLDSSIVNFDPLVRWPGPIGKAWKIPGDRLPRQEYRTTYGHFDLSRLLERARSHGLTLSEYLAALHLEVLERFQKTLDERFAKGKNKPLRILIPADLRRVFPSRSLRNFTGVVILELPVSSACHGFDEIAALVRQSMRRQRQASELSTQVARNVYGARLTILRVLPRVAVRQILRFCFRIFGAGIITSQLSNLGEFVLPPLIADHVVSVRFMPGPESRTGTNFGLVSYKNRLTVCSGSVLVDTQFEQSFFATLAHAERAFSPQTPATATPESLG